ncbi:DUF1593 domain-containing protein [Zunongwangia sp. F260]|uniref:DUF1593 domain-containing protein n=1 Tax=Autumnicola lenta TaxID=3075593 RepID=A0ABU3CHJ8_9FLAO|nr:nucleoside hydrolase-like domain-containing protein [Zunongwangia sp. F260]MDT0645815.1 DUF1593 domain-containing protein [Zunongwangia sp. F260]
MGIVKDKSTLLPVKGAEVKLLKSDVNVKTDKEGKFEIEIASLSTSNSIDSLIVSDNRYWPQQVKLQGLDTSNLEIKLNAAKHRLIVTSDLGGADPDDEQSMVHLLLGANEFDLEGLIMGLAWLKADQNQPGVEPLRAIIDAYEKVYPNLKIHANEYPNPDYLRSIVAVGQTLPNMSGVGGDKASRGSELIIKVVDKADDPRPVWLNSWGGANTIAQALWTVKQTRSKEEVSQFINKIRIFDILGQDDAGAWMAKTFPDLVYIRTKSIYGWAPSDDWISNNVQSHGPMGEVYPNRRWATEGDSPAFLHLWSNGLNDPDEIDQGGWGGRFKTKKEDGIRVMDIAAKTPGLDEKRYDPYYMFTNTSEGMEAINRWKQHIHNNLQARMDWSISENYEDANHHPVAILNGDETKQILEIKAAPGSTVELSAAGSNDPDRDSLQYSWSFYDEPSSYDGPVKIQNSSSISATVEIPEDADGKNIHIILQIHDDGKPNLYALRRAIIRVE